MCGTGAQAAAGARKGRDGRAKRRGGRRVRWHQRGRAQSGRVGSNGGVCGTGAQAAAGARKGRDGRAKKRVEAGAQASTGARARAERARRRERHRAQLTTDVRVDRARQHQRAGAAAGARVVARLQVVAEGDDAYAPSARQTGTLSAHSQPQERNGTKHGGHYRDGNVTQHCSLEAAGRHG